jgi:hypothetical protein
VRLADQCIASSDRVIEAVLTLRADQDPHVQLQLAYSLGEWHDHRDGQTIAELLSSVCDDNYRRTALLSSIGKHNVGEVLAFAGKQGAVL